MNMMIFIESFLNAIDFGAFIESMHHFRNRSWNLDPVEIIKHILFGKGYVNLTPPQLSRIMGHQAGGGQVIDLRESRKYREKHIQFAVSKPIDDFLKEIYEGKYLPDASDQKIILVCDTGQLSRYAASVMSEEGFTRVYSLKGGMRRWNRWQRLSRKIFFARMKKTGMIREAR